MAMTLAPKTPTVLPTTRPRSTPSVIGSDTRPLMASPVKVTPALARAKTGTTT